MNSIMESAFRYFEQAVKLGSIRRAAEHLHVSASSISRQIAKMEDAFGTPLLVRHASGVRLTPAGEAVARFVQSRSRHFQRLQASIDALMNLEKGLVTIFTVEGAVGGLLPDALARFSGDFPGIDYEVYVAGTDDVMRAVAEDRCDLGISYYPSPRPDVQAIASLQQPLLAVMSPGYRLAGRRNIDFAALGEEPVGIPDKTFGIRHLVDHVVKREQMKINIRLETNSIDMLRQFAISGMGVVFLPAFSLQREVQAGSLVGIALTNSALWEATLQISKRSETELTLPAERFLSYLTEAAGMAQGETSVA